MSSKKKTPATPSTSPQTLKIGSRVRCTDDGIEGRIVWANAVSVKIQWDDGEHVTWRRDSLSGRPIAILDAAGDEDEHAATADSEQAVAEPPVERVTTASASAEQPSEPPPAVPTEMEAVAREQTPATDTQNAEVPPAEPSPEAPTLAEQTAEKPETPSAVAKQPRTRKPQQAADDGQAKKLSALDAAAKVLGETDQAMSCQEMITQMAAKGYWTTPGGKTPAATLYSAIAREITAKGADSRFQKADRGKFARNGAA
jgi:hypothetical protein